MRIGDREREVVIAALREHVGAGRLTLDEFSERAELVWQCTTVSDLSPVLVDLPRLDQGSVGVAPPVHSGPVAHPGTPPGAAHAPGQGVEPIAASAGRRRVIAVMSGADVRGRWQVAPRLQVVAFWGGARIDLRDAIIASPVVDISAVAIMGGVTIIVPEGIPVELDGMVLMGGCSNRTRPDLALPGAPLVRVHAAGLWGGVDVRSRPSRRSRVDPELDEGDDGPTEPPDSPDPPEAAEPPQPARSPGGAVPRERPTLPEGTLTVLFTDIVGSTGVVERVGDQRWSEVLRTHDESVRAVVTEHGGTVVKSNGDGYLVVFTSARRAILAGLGIQRAVRVIEGTGERGLPVRIGLHTGEVVEQDGDVFGRNVIAAARIAGRAGPGQVLVSSLTKGLVESAGDLDFSAGQTLELRGLAHPWTVHEVSLSR